MKRRCRTCLQPTTKPPLERKRVIGSLLYDYRCPSCGKTDKDRREADVRWLFAQGRSPGWIAHRLLLTLREVVGILAATTESRSISSDARAPQGFLLPPGAFVFSG